MSFDPQALMGHAAAWAAHESAAALPSVEPTVKPRELPMPPLPLKLSAQVEGFGGRQARYTEQTQKQERAFDPVDQVYVTFPNYQHYLAFLIVRFSGTRELEIRPEAIAYRRARTTGSSGTFTARADMKYLSKDNRTVYVWVSETWSAEEEARLKHFELTHSTAERKVSVLLLTWEHFDDQRCLIENLEAARQLMTSTAHAAVNLTCVAKAVYAFMARRRECTRGELGAELTCEGCLECDEHLDATLFHLHALGGLRLNLDTSEYGDDTVISFG